MAPQLSRHFFRTGSSNPVISFLLVRVPIGRQCIAQWHNSCRFLRRNLSDFQREGRLFSLETAEIFGCCQCCRLAYSGPMNLSRSSSNGNHSTTDNLSFAGTISNQRHPHSWTGSVIKRGEKIFTQKFRVAVLKDREEPVETTECKLTPLKRKIRFPETFGIELSACTNSIEA